MMESSPLRIVRRMIITMMESASLWIVGWMIIMMVDSNLEKTPPCTSSE